MYLVFPKELQTSVEAASGFIIFFQENDDGTESCIKLTVHQFQEIWNREKQLIEAAYSDVRAEWGDA